jgi:tRNA G10  N-methylase Trm11
MEYFFILGRNPELSRAELFSYLGSRKIFFKEFNWENNLLVLDLKQELKLDIQELGGLLSMGKLMEFSNEKDLFCYLEKNEFVELDKFTYSILGNLDSSIFSEKFKKEKKKAQIRNFGKKLRFQSGENIFIPKVDVEFFASYCDNVFLLGLVEQSFSSKSVEKRDMGKPVRRESLAISPRLARVLVNLSGAKEGDLILDPFCGVGGIVQEAVLMGINCVGIDSDPEAIRGAKENLAWLNRNFSFKGRCEFICSNSLNAQNKQYDAIVAESSLGEVLRRKLNAKQARIYLDDFKRQIIPLLRRFKEIKKSNAKIAITFPCFEGVEISKEEVLSLTGLKLFELNNLSFPIVEKREKQFVNRQIWVFY